MIEPLRDRKMIESLSPLRLSDGKVRVRIAVLLHICNVAPSALASPQKARSLSSPNDSATW